MTERLQKVMAHAGVASRRKSEEIIRQGRVRVNGELVRRPGYKVEPKRDTITVDGQEIAREERVYLILNKPPGYVTTVRDPRGRPTVMDLVQVEQRVYPVGRLDKDACGLLLFTNDGELANLLTHPRYEISKEYRVRITDEFKRGDICCLERGVKLEDGWTAPTEVDIIEVDSGRGQSELLITLHEGRKRQIKRMFSHLGYSVIFLQRLSMGPLHLGSLREGESRHLNAEEQRALATIKKAGKI